ncbi:MAG TPA: hypothetical protein VF641_00880, partial [Methylobacterium sp.]
VRAAITDASQQMNAVFEAASGRFGDSVAGMREMAAQIRRELDATRADLQRGIIELPRETQDATGEMRRVVSDQIKALSELSALVAQAPRAVDVAQPQAAQAAQTIRPALSASPAQPAQARPVGSRVAEAPPRAPVAAPAPGAPMQATARPQQQLTASVAAPARAGTPPAAVRREDVRAGGDKRGWLSDLLTRASIDDEPDETPPAAVAPPPSKPAPERSRTALDTISTEIGRMIDHQTAVDLWERYRRGEPNLFDRRLYTPQGRQTFEEIRRRYGSDPDFRRTVDRYVNEFERLLGDVSKNDQDSKRADAYLTSETGKVYTMLAHASGRFDGA